MFPDFHLELKPSPQNLRSPALVRMQSALVNVDLSAIGEFTFFTQSQNGTVPASLESRASITADIWRLQGVIVSSAYLNLETFHARLHHLRGVVVNIDFALTGIPTFNQHQLTEFMQSTHQDMQEVKAGVIEIRSEIRLLSSRQTAHRNGLAIAAIGDQAPLIPVPAWQGPNAGQIPHPFPTKIRSLNQWGIVRLTNLLTFYGIVAAGSARKRAARATVALTEGR